MMMRKARQRGFSLLEMIVVVLITAVILIAVYSMIDDATMASMFAETHNDLPVFGQQAVNDIQTEVFQAREVFGNDTLGTGYLGRMTMPAAFPLQADSLMPNIDPNGTLTPDPGTGASRDTGNCLLIARTLQPKGYDVGGGVTLSIDRYQFEFFYLSRATTRTFATASYVLQPVRADSTLTYADAFQVNGLTNAQKTTLFPLLIADGITKAWNPAQPVAAAFFTIQSGGTTAADPSHTITLITNKVIDPTVSPTTRMYIPPGGPVIRGMTGGRISGRVEYSIAFRPSVSTTFFQSREPIEKYAVYDTTLPNFPGGFEFKIVGPAGSRQILTRLLLFARYHATQFDERETTVITPTRF